ncbi:hypothetical protein ES707_04011 [subsurface metagenome]
MRNVMLFAAVITGAGVLMAQMADRMAPAPAHANVARSEAPVAAVVPPSAVRSISIAQDGRGHFQTDARIDGALNERSAARFGLRPSRNDYNATVATANGSLKAARARIPMMDVGGLIVRDVEAMVLPDEALSENLLGLSFLSKLRRFEYANGRLVLEQ